MKIFGAMAAAAAVALFAGCGPQASEADVKKSAQALTSDGTVEKASKETGSEGKLEWQVILAMNGGGKVEAVYSPDSGELLELESETGPFEYELTVSNGFIPYSQAKTKALATKSGAVEAWEFESEKNQWEFYVRDANQQLWEIKLKATDGTVTSTEAKAARD